MCGTKETSSHNYSTTCDHKVLELLDLSISTPNYSTTCSHHVLELLNQVCLLTHNKIAQLLSLDAKIPHHSTVNNLEWIFLTKYSRWLKWNYLTSQYQCQISLTWHSQQLTMKLLDQVQSSTHNGITHPLSLDAKAHQLETVDDSQWSCSTKYDHRLTLELLDLFNLTLKFLDLEQSMTHNKLLNQVQLPTHDGIVQPFGLNAKAPHPDAINDSHWNY